MVPHCFPRRLVNRLNAEHGVEDFVEFYEAAGGLPAVYLMHPRGHTVEIHLQVRLGLAGWLAVCQYLVECLSYV